MSVTLYSKKDGQGQPFAEEELPAALASGEWGFASERVDVIHPKTGKRETIPYQNVPRWLASKYELVSDEQKRLDAQGVSEFEQKALALGVPAVGAATLGGADLLLGGLTELTGDREFYNATMADVKGAHPGLTLGGELGGLGLGLYGGGVPAGLESLGTRLTSRIASAPARGFARGALTGGGYGLSQFVRDGVTDENPNWSIEKLALMTGSGALLGGTIEGGFGLAQKLTSGAVSAWGKSKAAGGVVSEFIERKSAEKAVTSMATQADLKAARLLPGVNQEEEVRKLGQWALDKGFFKLTPQQTLEAVDAYRTQIGAEMNKILDAKFPGFRVDIKKPLDEMTNLAADLDRKPASRDLAETVWNKVQQYAEHGPGGSRPGLTFREAWDDQSSLLSQLEKIGPSEAKREAYVEMRRSLRENILEQLEKAGQNSDELRMLTSEYRNAANYETVAKRAVQRSMGNLSFGLMDTLTGAALGGGSTAGTLVGIAGRKLLREYGPGLVIPAANRLAKTRFLEQSATGFLKFVEAGLASAPTWGGPFRAVLSNAAARGASDLLDTHIQLAASSPEYMTEMGLKPETPEMFKAAVEKSANLSYLRDRMDEVDGVLDAGAESVVQGSGVADTPATLKKEDLSKIEANLRSFLQNPKVDPDLAKLESELAPNVAGKHAQIADFLLSKLPTEPRAGEVVSALKDDWQPSAVELSRFTKTLRAALDPSSILTSAAAGRLSIEEMEVMRSVYPEMLAKTQEMMMSRMQAYGGRLSYKQRLNISYLMGAPVGGAGSRVALIQGVRAKQRQQVAEGGGSRTDGRQVVSQGKNLETQNQRIEARGGVK